MKPRWGVIDAASIAEAREMIGVGLRRDRMQWVECATRDAIRQFCLGVGETNPLWGRGFAPPSFLYAVDATIVAPKLAGVQWIYAGTKWRWFDRIRVNDQFDTSARLTRVDEKTGRRFGTWVLQTGEVNYHRADGTLLGLAEGRVARTPRRETNSEKNKEKAAKVAPGAPAELTSHDNSIALGSSRRGAQVRRWESVAPGDPVAPVHRKLHLVDIYRWYMGAQGALHYGGAHGDAIRYRHRHDDYEINTTTGAKDAAARGHFSAKVGKDVGMGGAYDVGPHRISWIIAMLTDWMGDDGFLAELEVDVLRPNLVDDTTYFSGEVIRTWQADQAFASVSIRGLNQHGALTTSGTATIALESALGPVCLPLVSTPPTR